MSKRFFAPALVTALVAIALPIGAQPAQQDFPDGPGKQIFLGHCGACHELGRARGGYAPQGWHTVVRMMLNFDVPVAGDQVEALTEYLIKSFPERPRPAAVTIDGPVQASIKLDGCSFQRVPGSVMIGVFNAAFWQW